MKAQLLLLRPMTVVPPLYSGSQESNNIQRHSNQTHNPLKTPTREDKLNGLRGFQGGTVQEVALRLG